jgi:hypothetical protein
MFDRRPRDGAPVFTATVRIELQQQGRNSMRTSILAGLATATFLVIAPAHAVPVRWDLQSTVTRTNDFTLMDQAMSVSMVVETSTPGNPIFFANGYSFLNAFQSFDLTIGDRTLNLGPLSDDPLVARDTNNLGTLNFDDHQVLGWTVRLFDGATPYVVETRFEFTDLNAFPIGSLPLAPPSLESARLTDISLYLSVETGGMLFIASGPVESFTAVRGVPEPSTFAMLLGALGGMAFVRRRRAGNPSV